MADFVTALHGMVFGAAEARILAIFTPMIEEVEALKKTYGRELVLKGIGTAQQPDFSPAGKNTHWKPLADSWLKRKKATRANQRFYSGISEKEGKTSLREALLAMPTEKIFGKTQLRSRVDAGRRAIKSKGFTRRGRVIETVYRNANRSGQFSKPPIEMTTSWTIDAFPNLYWKEGEAAKAMIKELGLAKEQTQKLEYNHGARALIVPFTEWFLRTKIQSVFDKYKAKL